MDFLIAVLLVLVGLDLVVTLVGFDQLKKTTIRKFEAATFSDANTRNDVAFVASTVREALRNPAVLEVLEANTAQDFRDREHEYANSKKIEEGLENILSYSVKSATGMETTP